MYHYTLPLICGWDLSGVVVGRGPQVSRFQQGDEVYSRPDLSRNGAYAEYIVVRESEIAFKPKALDHVHSAGVPLAALTAWQALFDAAQLRSGQKAMIHAAAGGVGHFAVQLAKWRGAYVIGTCSKDNQDFVRGLGADEAVDYQSSRFEEYVRNADVVLDTIGGDTQKRSWKILKKGGILVSIVSPPSKEEAETNGMQQAFVFVQPNSTQLSEITNLIDSGELKVTVEKVFPLSQAREAQQLSQQGHTRGKIVLKVV